MEGEEPDACEAPGPGNTGETGCGVSNDGLVCWPFTLQGQVARVNCFNIKVFAEAIRNLDVHEGQEHHAYKHCLPTGWAEKGDYEECIALISVTDTQQNSTVTEDDRARNRRILANINVYLSILSLACLLISLLIFSFKSLQCDRLRIHKNFMVSLVLYGLLTILQFAPYTTQQGPEHVWYHSYPWVCRGVLGLFMFCFQAPVYWMFIEGINLHSKVSFNVFSSAAPMALYYCVGWGLPLLLSMGWMLAMTLSGEQAGRCWDDYSDSPLANIIIVPVLVSLTVNLLLLVSIVKVVVTKLRVQGSLSTQQIQIRRAVRATLILFPLLGMTNLFFFINPKNLGSQIPEHQYVYMVVNSVLKSSQGIFLSFLYCFFNNEVQETLRRHIRRFHTQAALDGDMSRRSSNMKGRMVGSVRGSLSPNPPSSRFTMELTPIRPLCSSPSTDISGINLRTH